MTINYNSSSLLDTIQNNGNKYTKSYTKRVREADEDVEDFQEKFEDFRKVVRNLHNYSSTSITDDKLKTYLTKLTDTYNSMVKNKDSITDSSLQKQLDKLDTLIDDNAKSLKKLGLKKTDGKLEFDEDTFDDDADKKTINKLFTGTDSFIDQAYKLMRKIDKSASDAQYVTTEYNLHSTTKYSDADILNANVYLLMQQSGSLLNDYYKYNQNNMLEYNEETNKDNINQILYSLSLGLESADKTDRLTGICSDNKDNLKKLGISYDADNKTITYSEPSSIDEDAFNALFSSDEGSFYTKLSAYCKDGYSQTMQLDKIGVTLIDESV